MVQTASMDAKRSSESSSVGPGAGNAFANDGSFLDMFKKKMEEEKGKKATAQGDRTSAEGEQATEEKKTFSVTSFVGKRRGGAKLALKTGMVAKKQRLETEAETGKGEAWNTYMAEVRKYKAHQCGDDDKTRPLVK
ncbi:hypothetical protein AAFF_G00290530 [Aldrovandia affinis]|uniref:Telomerase RNA component interacting RNase n=1 Tax=Aldrovandia affinis TaxID=143900 RepID=A0AAD7R9H7_9TELE|nr:hypothetical protein AAFF_G00290530 [Aldrovandia affinis]